jgi:hypothetical protein
MENRHSRIGIASFVLSLVAGISMLLLVAVAGIMKFRNPSGSPEGKIIIGVVAIALLFLDFLAAALGIATVCQKEQKKLFGVLGLSFSLLLIIGLVGLIVFGLIAGKYH